MPQTPHTRPSPPHPARPIQRPGNRPERSSLNEHLPPRRRPGLSSPQPRSALSPIRQIALGVSPSVSASGARTRAVSPRGRHPRERPQRRCQSIPRGDSPILTAGHCSRLQPTHESSRSGRRAGRPLSCRLEGTYEITRNLRNESIRSRTHRLIGLPNVTINRGVHVPTSRTGLRIAQEIRRAQNSPLAQTGTLRCPLAIVRASNRSRQVLAHRTARKHPSKSNSI